MYSYLYVVVDVFQDDVNLVPGVLLAWDNHGKFYTITTFDRKTLETKPLANIFLVKRMKREEKECVAESWNLCKCIPDLEELLRIRLLDAAKVFMLDGKRIDELYERALLAAGCKNELEVVYNA